MDNPTRILRQIEQGDRASAERLFEIIYEELRRLAGAYFRDQPADHTLQPTALVHEAFLKMIDQPSARVGDRAHFFAIAATAMRQVLVNHAHARSALKRGGDRRRVPLDETPGALLFAADDDLIALDQALTKLAGLDERKARVVEARFFGGLTVDETATVLGVSKTTAENDWRMARAWLSRELGDNEAEST